MDKNATWKTFKGAACPHCRFLPEPRSKNVTTQKKIIDNIRIRYHKCPKCGYKFKSVEDCN